MTQKECPSTEALSKQYFGIGGEGRISFESIHRLIHKEPIKGDNPLTKELMQSLLEFSSNIQLSHFSSKETPPLFKNWRVEQLNKLYQELGKGLGEDKRLGDRNVSQRWITQRITQLRQVFSRKKIDRTDLVRKILQRAQVVHAAKAFDQQNIAYKINQKKESVKESYPNMAAALNAREDSEVKNESKHEEVRQERITDAAKAARKIPSLVSLCKEYKDIKIAFEKSKGSSDKKMSLEHQLDSAKSNILKNLDKMFSTEDVPNATNELTELDSKDKNMILRDILGLKSEGLSEALVDAQIKEEVLETAPLRALKALLWDITKAVPEVDMEKVEITLKVGGTRPLSPVSQALTQQNQRIQKAMKSLLTLYKNCGVNGEKLEEKLKACQLGNSHKAALYVHVLGKQPALGGQANGYTSSAIVYAFYGKSLKILLDQLATTQPSDQEQIIGKVKLLLTQCAAYTNKKGGNLEQTLRSMDFGDKRKTMLVERVFGQKSTKKKGEQYGCGQIASLAEASPPPSTHESANQQQTSLKGMFDKMEDDGEKDDFLRKLQELLDQGSVKEYKKTRENLIKSDPQLDGVLPETQDLFDDMLSKDDLMGKITSGSTGPRT